MTARARPPSDEERAAIRERAERVLSGEEAAAYLAAPFSADEEADALSLIAWFRRRYPTPAERLAYARRAYRRWSAGTART